MRPRLGVMLFLPMISQVKMLFALVVVILIGIEVQVVVEVVVIVVMVIMNNDSCIRSSRSSSRY